MEWKRKWILFGLYLIAFYCRNAWIFLCLDSLNQRPLITSIEYVVMQTLLWSVMSIRLCIWVYILGCYFADPKWIRRSKLLGLQSTTTTKTTTRHNSISDGVPKRSDNIFSVKSGEIFRATTMAVVAFLLAWVSVPVVAVIMRLSTDLDLIALILYIFESFCHSEAMEVMSKPLPVLWRCGGRAMDFGYLKIVAAMGVCTAQSMLGLWSPYTYLILGFSLLLISLHNVIPRSAYLDGNSNKVD